MQLAYLVTLMGFLVVGAYLVVRQVLIRRELEEAAKVLGERVRTGEATSEVGVRGAPLPPGACGAARAGGSPWQRRWRGGTVLRGTSCCPSWPNGVAAQSRFRWSWSPASCRCCLLPAACHTRRAGAPLPPRLLVCPPGPPGLIA